MAATLHYGMATQLQHFRQGKGAGKEARLPVLLYLMLRANTQLRCWALVETIVADTGIGKPRVIEALHWLVEHKAVYLVPVDKRVGTEKNLKRNRCVYQLTGVILLDQQVVEYLYLHPTERATLRNELMLLEATAILACLNGSENDTGAAENGSDSIQEDGSENEQAGTKNGSLSTPIELESDQRTTTPELIRAAGAATDSAALPESAAFQAESLDSKSATEPTTPPRSAAPSPSLFEVICEQGFRLDPKRLPVHPRTGKPMDGGRIGKIRKEALALYPTLTPAKMAAMYAAYYRALPEVKYLKSLPLTLDYLIEFMQTGTIKPPFAPKMGKSSTQNIAPRQGHGGRIIDCDFRSAKNAYHAYLRDELPLLNLPAGYADWLETHYWAKQQHSNTILGSAIVRGLAKFEQARRTIHETV